MKSVTSSVARNYRLQEWAAQIRECQNRLPGTSVKRMVWAARCNRSELLLSSSRSA